MTPSYRVILEEVQSILSDYKAGHDVESSLTNLAKALGQIDDGLAYSGEGPVVFVDGERIMLSPLEARTFELLYSRRGEEVSAKDLILNAFGDSMYFASDSQRVTQIISLLRKKLKCDSSNPRFIDTIWGHKAWVLHPGGVTGGRLK